MKCPNCDFLNSQYLYKYQDFDSSNFDLRCTSLQYQKPNLIKCKECKLIFSELLNLKFENLYEDVEDQLYIDQIPFKEKYFKNTLKKINKHLNKNKSVLEIGSYYGIFGSLIKPIVKDYVGLELSRHAVSYAKKKYSLNFINQTIDGYLNGVEQLDVIIMSHVIEHLDDPFENIKNISNKMNNESVLIFSTYNMDSLIAKILGKNYQWIMPMHKYYFTKKVLKQILNKYNLDIVETITDTHVISLKYFFIKINAIVPFMKLITSPLLKMDFLNKINIKINLGDLDIYCVKKI